MAENCASDFSMGDASTDLPLDHISSDSDWTDSAPMTLTKYASEGKLLNLSRNSAGKVSSRPRSPSAKRCWPGSVNVQRLPSAPEDAKARVDIYVRLGRLEEQLAAEQQLRLDAQSRLLALEQKSAGHAGQVNGLELRHLVEQAMGDLSGNIERTIVERAVAEAKAEACIALADKLQELQVQSRSLVADVEMKLARDRATKMQTTDGRDVGDLAEQLEAHQSRLESLETSIRSVDCQASQTERTADDGAVQTRLKSLIGQLDSACSDVAPNRNLRSSMQRSVSPKRNVKFSNVVEEREIRAEAVDSLDKDSQFTVQAADPTIGGDTNPAACDSALDKLKQQLKEENFRLREQNLENQRNGTKPSAKGASKGVYRSTSAEDATRLLGRLTQQSSQNSQAQALGKTGIYRSTSAEDATRLLGRLTQQTSQNSQTQAQQSSDASFPTQTASGQTQRAATLGNLTASQSLSRRNPGPGSSLTAPPGQSPAQQQLRQPSASQHQMRRP